MNHSCPFKAFIALITGITFLTTSVIWAPDSFAMAQTVQAPAPAAPEVFLPYQAKLDPGIQFSIPQELGTLQYFKAGKGPMVVHLQTAHGHYQAQKQIQAILHHLDKQYGIRTLLVEGSAFKLEPDILNFFPEDPALTQKVNDALTQAALVKGPELYLLDKTGERGTGNGERSVRRSTFHAGRAKDLQAEAFGIENLEAYRENGVAFVNVLTEKKKTGHFLAVMNDGIDRLAAAYLNEALRGYLKRLESFEKGQMPLEAWLSSLKKEALKRLKLDLAQPVAQLDWPMLVRILKIQEISAKFNKDAFAKEREKFLKALRRFLPSSYSQIEQLLKSGQMSQQLPALETSLLFEDMVKALPRNFNYEAFPNVCYFIGRLLLQSELKAPELIQETERLSSEIADKLAKTKAEKELVALLKDYRLLQKLFALELTPADHEQILSRNGNSLKPSSIIKRLQEVERSAASVARVKNVHFVHIAALDRLFDAAMQFYAGVKERDGLMEQMIEKRLQETGADKVAVITGGFHSEPFKNYFSSKDYSYALISPRITGGDDKGHEAYVENMLRFAEGVRRTAYGEKQSVPFSSSQSAATRELEFLSDPQVLSGTYGVNAAIVRAEVRKIVSEVAGRVATSPTIDSSLQTTAKVSGSQSQDFSLSSENSRSEFRLNKQKKIAISMAIFMVLGGIGGIIQAVRISHVESIIATIFWTVITGFIFAMLGAALGALVGVVAHGAVRLVAYAFWRVINPMSYFMWRLQSENGSKYVENLTQIGRPVVPLLIENLKIKPDDDWAKGMRADNPELVPLLAGLIFRKNMISRLEQKAHDQATGEHYEDGDAILSRPDNAGHQYIEGYESSVLVQHDESYALETREEIARLQNEVEDLQKAVQRLSARSEMRGKQTTEHRLKPIAKFIEGVSRLLSAVSRRGGVAKRWILVAAVLSLPFAIPIAIGYGILHFFQKRLRERVTAEGVRQIKLSPENAQALNELREAFLLGVKKMGKGALTPFTESLMKGFHNTMLGALLVAGLIEKNDFWADQKFVKMLGEIAAELESGRQLLDMLLEEGSLKISPQFDAALKEAEEESYSGVSGELSRLIRDAKQRRLLMGSHRIQVQEARTLLAAAKATVEGVVRDLPSRSEVRTGVLGSRMVDWFRRLILLGRLSPSTVPLTTAQGIFTRRRVMLAGMFCVAAFAGLGCGGGGGGNAGPSSAEVLPEPVADPVGEWSMVQNGDEYKLLFGDAQYASILKNGYIRLTLTPGQHVGWGTSFVTPSYWTGGQYYHNMRIENINIQPSEDGTMVLTGRLESQHLFASNFRLVFGRPRGDHTFMDGSYTLQAKSPISFDVTDHPYEYLKGPQFSSMNVGSAKDFDQLFTSNGQYSIQNRTSALNPSPQWDSPSVTAALVNTTKGPSNFGELKPTAYIQVGGAPGQVAVQGWLQQELDPNADNVGAWFAMQSLGYVSFRAGVVPPGAFSLRPEMSPPALVTQPLGPQLPTHTPAELAGLPGNPDKTVVYAPGAFATAIKTDRGIYITFDTGSAGWSGGGFTYDDFSTTAIETSDLSSLNNMRFEIHGQIPPGALIKMEVVDADDRKATVYLDKITAEEGKVWRIPRAAIDQYGPVDMSRIRLIYFIVEGNGTGLLYVNDKPPRSEARQGAGPIKLLPENVRALSELNGTFLSAMKKMGKGPLIPFAESLTLGFPNTVFGAVMAAETIKRAGFLADREFVMLGATAAELEDGIRLLDMLSDGPFKISPQFDAALKKAVKKSYSGVPGELGRLIRNARQRKLLMRSYRAQVQEARDLLATAKTKIEGVIRDPSFRSREAHPLASSVQEYYAQGTTDEFMPPIILTDAQENPLGRIQDGESVIFWNFRGDRGREIARAFLDPKVQADPVFAGMRSPQDLTYVTMTDYEQGLVPPENVAYPAAPLKGTIGEVVSNAGLRQFRISETEKYAHVTFFFNGGLESEFPGEERKVIPSPKEVKTYDLKPEMSVGPVTDALLERLKSRKDHMVIVNFPNADMVGHTGNFPAVQKAVEAVDAHLGRVVAEAQAQGVHTVIIADHGNAEEMGPADNRQTNHSKNPVPFIFIPAEAGVKKQGTVPKNGRLADVAPTMLEVMGLPQPSEMTGESLLQGFEFSREEQQKVLLIILDGWGHNPDRQDPNDAIRTANTPHMDGYLQKYPNTLLLSNGLNVGLPGDTMGSSEVGHSNIGGGRVDDQPVVVIDKAIENGEFFKNPALLKAVRNAKKNHGALHLMGLLSDGLVHSKMDHVGEGLLELAKRGGIHEVYLHAILDGRDTPPQSGVQWLADLQTRIDQRGVGKIADVIGRFYPMDRDKRWERVAVGYKAYVSGPEGYQKGEKIFADGKEVPFVFVHPRASATPRADAREKTRQEGQRSEMRDDTGEQRLVAAIEDGMRQIETLRRMNSSRDQGMIQELQSDIISYQRALFYIGGISHEVELPAILTVAPIQTVYEVYRAASKVSLPDPVMKILLQDIVRFFYGVSPQGQEAMPQRPEFQTYTTLVTQRVITSEDKGLLLSKPMADAREAFVRAYASQLKFIEQTALWLPLPELPKMLHEARPLANGIAPIRIVAERTVPAKADTKEAGQLQTALLAVFLKNLVISNVKNRQTAAALKFKVLISEAKSLLTVLRALPAEAGRLSEIVSPRSEVRLEKLEFRVTPIRNSQGETTTFSILILDREKGYPIAGFDIPVTPGTGESTYTIYLSKEIGEGWATELTVTLDDQGRLENVGDMRAKLAWSSNKQINRARLEAVQGEMKAFLESKIGQPWGPDLFRTASSSPAGGARSEARSGKFVFSVSSSQYPQRRMMHAISIFDLRTGYSVGVFSIPVTPGIGKKTHTIHIPRGIGGDWTVQFTVTLNDRGILERVVDVTAKPPAKQSGKIVDEVYFEAVRGGMQAFLESKIGQLWGPDLFRTASGVNVPEVPRIILREMADETPNFSIEWSRKEQKGFPPEIARALQYWTPILYTRRPLDVARTKNNRTWWQENQITHELPVAAQLLKKMALELTREDISRLTARDFEEVASTLQTAVADGRSLQRAGRASRAPKSYDQLEVLANSPDLLKIVLNKLKTIYEAEIQKTQATPPGTPDPRRSELRLSDFADVITPEEITLIEHFYFSILPMQLREWIEASGGREAVLEVLRKIPGILVSDMAVDIPETSVLDGLFAPEASLAIPETAGKGLAVAKTVTPTVKNFGGKVFLGQDILPRLMAENPRALFYLLKTYSVFMEQNEAPVLLTVGSPDLLSQIKDALINRNSGLRGFEISERAALIESLEAGKILEVIEPAQGASEAQVIGLETAKTDGGIASLHLSAAMIPSSTQGVHFAFGENVGARDLMVASVFAIVLKSAADLLYNIPDAKARAELLNKFFEENLPGVQMKKQGSNSFVITQITMLAQEFAARAYIATRA